MPADLHPFRQAIIRISSEAEKFYGIGCLLNASQAITCAHVVADALGYNRDIDFIPDGRVQINRPFAENSTHSVTAQVEKWLPRGEQKLSDMALLQLDEPLTEPISIKLSYVVNLKGIRFKAWGGPAGHELHLIDIEGSIADAIGNGRYRLDVKNSNYKIEPGCSGAPIIDIETGQVLGLIAQEELDKNIPAGFLIPATHWRQTGWFPEPNAGAALEPLKTWLKNHYNRRYRERQRIENFVAYYAGIPAEPMPFAGREEWLQQLDQWLSQDQSRFLLLSGSAGRGKSALLLHWLARIISQQPTLTLLFLPISIRFETSNELEGLRLLHAALCDYFADLAFSSNDKPDINDYRDRLFDGWERIANQPKQRYLLVIDGIDESANHWLLKEVLPRELPTNWHLLLSARHRPGETDGTTWLSALGITGERLELPPLTLSAIAEAIIQLGRPLDELAEQQAFVEQLYRLTDQGDPLLLTLWIGQIWQHREATPQLKIEQLQQLQPSFASFYDIWLKEQQKNLASKRH
ncbi:MAG: NACHT domain-containing protein [Thioploca sp.]|nr:NACHT domain-containing protein [Thioploca sp.]